MALPYSGQNPFEDVSPEDYSRISFSSGFRGEGAPSQQYMLDQLRKQGFSNEYLLGALENQFGPESSDYFQSLIFPQAAAPAPSPAPAPAPAPTPAPAPAPAPAPSPLDALSVGAPAAALDTSSTVGGALGVLGQQQDTTTTLPAQGALQGALQVAAAPAAPAEGTPEWFRNYIYQGGADDATATQRGLDWVVSQGMRPQEAVNLWNQSLGTNFNVSDFFRETGSEPLFSNFGESDSWTTGGQAVNDPTTGMIKSSGAYFQRGNEAVVSDELFWNPNSPTGQALQQRVTDARAQGQRPGVVITPYAVFQGKATNEQLLDEIRNSGADFVALDPYLGWGVPADQLYEWTKNFIPQVNALGKEVKLVTQGFAKKGEEDAARSYNSQLLALPGVSEFVNFGLEDWFAEGSEDAKKLFAPDSEWTTLGNDYGQPQKRSVGTVGGEQARAGETAGGALPSAEPAAGAPAASAAATQQGALTQAAPGTPQAALQQAISQNPNFANELINQFVQERGAAEGSSQAQVGQIQVGDYAIRPVSWETIYPEEGVPYNPANLQYKVSGYELYKSGKTPEGKPLEFFSLTDDKGNITGTTVRYYTGSDSGVEFQVDAQGNQVGSPKGFDFSESWKADVAPLVSMAAMAFAGPLAETLSATLGGGAATFASNVASNAIVRGGLAAAQAALTGQDPLKAGLTGAVTGAVSSGGAALANQAASAVLDATGSQIAADAVRGAVQSGLNAVPGAVVSGNLTGLGQAALTGAITSGVGSAASQALSGTGITPQQVSSGLALAQQLQSGKPNISAIANAAAGLVNSPDATVAAKAISLMDTISKAGANPAAFMGIMDAANQLSQAVNAAQGKGSDPAAAAYAAAKRAGATDAEAAAAARQITGGDAIDQATARATGLPILQMPIPEIEIIDEEWGNLTQAQKDAAQRNTLKIASGEANTPEEAAALAKAKGFGMFEFGGSRYTIGASAQEVLNAAGQAQEAKQVAGTTGKEAGKIVPGWGREGNLIQGFNNATVGTTNAARAAELLRQVYGDAVDWVDQGTLNAAASYIYANREDLLLKDLQAGDIKGIGAYGIKTPQDITSVAKDYIVEGGARIAGPAEVSGADVGYDANGVPIAVVKTAGTTTGKKMTEEERNRYDFEMGLEEARKQTDPFTGESLAINPITGKEFTFDDFQNSSTVRDTIRGIAAPVMKGVGELGQLAGYATGSTALTEAAANLEAQGRSITPQVVREGTTNLINDIQNADGMLNKGKAIVNAFIERPWQTAAAVADLTGTELTQEFLPFGASLAAGKAVSAATRAKFGQLVSERAGTIAGVTANATSDGIEAGLQTAQQVYNDLRSQGFGHERATDMAFKAGVLSSIVETAASVVGEGPMMSGLVKGVPGSVARTTVREGISEFPAGYLQTAIGDIATNRLGTFDPNAAQTGGYLETLAGGPTSGVIQAGGNIFTQAGEAAAGTAGTQAATTGTQATAPTTAPAADVGTAAGTATLTQTGQDAATIINDYVATVLQGGDASTAASTSVGNIINSAVTGGADVSQATSNAVGSIITSAASTGANVSAATSSSVSGAVTSAVNSGADVAAVTQSAVGSAVTSAVTSGLDATTAVNSAVGGAVTSAVTSGANVGATINSAVGSAVTSAVTSGSDVSTAVTSAVGSAVTSAVTSGSDASTAVTSAVTSSVSSAVTSAVNTGTDVSTATTTAVNSAVTSAVTSAVNSGVDVSTAVTSSVNSAVNSAVTSAVNTGSDVSTAVNTAVTSSVNSAVTAAVNSGTDVNTAVNTAVNSAVSSAVTTAVNTGADVSTAVNTAVNSAVTAAVTTAVNTGQSVNTAVNTAVNSAVTTAVNTAVNTGQSVNTAINTAVNAAVTAAVSTGVSTNVAVSAAVDAVKKLGYDDVTATNLVTDSVTTLTAETPATTTTTTTTKTLTPPKVTPPTSGGFGGISLGLPIAAGTLPNLPPQFLKSFETQKYIDPFAGVKAAEARMEQENMMQNIDPRLLAVMQERMGQRAPEGALGAVNEPYYSYGEEDSIEDILGGRAANYAQGGYVAPLMATGGMTLPLMAKEGGLPTHKSGREDFKDGKHVAGEGDGQSDDIPAWLADGEFVFPADVVSALGNGSTKAGTDKLYEMMHSIRARARSKGPKDLPPPALKSPLDYLKSKK